MIKKILWHILLMIYGIKDINLTNVYRLRIIPKKFKSSPTLAALCSLQDLVPAGEVSYNGVMYLNVMCVLRRDNVCFNYRCSDIYQKHVV